jgi:predicted RNA-binding protein YlqC (UPF0109 family)
VTTDVVEVVRDVVGIVRHFVDHPENVEINVVPGPYRITVELYTHSKDVGQVIGKDGHISASLRSFLSAIAGKNRIRIDLEYVTDKDNARAREKANS